MIAKNLISWHETIDRNLPWKENDDPYRIWLSEIIMQQTRVEQGTPYYLRFIDAYPTIEDLAKADIDDVLNLWQGLGYYSRAKNLHFTARFIVDIYDGVFPTTYEEVVALKGIGEYTAAAIMSFAYQQCYPVIDGNVKRVISRVAGIYSAIDQKEGITEIKRLAGELIDKKDPARYNQAIMDFGALVCKPKNPLCQECSLSIYCIALKDETVGVLPFKAKKMNKSDVYLHYAVIMDEYGMILSKRSDKGIWKGLYEPILLDVDRPSTLDLKDILQLLEIEETRVLNYDHTEMVKHVLTHKNLYARFYFIELKKVDHKDYVAYPHIHEKPVPKLIENVLISRGILES